LLLRASRPARGDHAVARRLEVALGPVRGLLRRPRAGRRLAQARCLHPLVLGGRRTREPGADRRARRRGDRCAQPLAGAVVRGRARASRAGVADRPCPGRGRGGGCRTAEAGRSVVLCALWIDPLRVPPLQRRGGRRPRARGPPACSRCTLRPMIRFLIRMVIAVVANAVGLLVAAALLDGMHVNAGSFVVAVIIFTVAFALMQPFLVSQFRRGNSAALGGVALIATLVALIVTDLISDGFSIDGVGTWIAATVIVWLAALLAAFILPFLGLKKYLEERRD